MQLQDCRNDWLAYLVSDIYFCSFFARSSGVAPVGLSHIFPLTKIPGTSRRRGGVAARGLDLYLCSRSGTLSLLCITALCILNLRIAQPCSSTNQELGIEVVCQAMMKALQSHPIKEWIRSRSARPVTQKKSDKCCASSLT